MKMHFWVLRFKNCLLYGSVLGLAVLLALRSETAMSAARSSLTLCFKTVIPSLFPFFVLSSLLSTSGFVSLLSRALSPIMLPLFRVNGAGALPFSIGMISGYPMGAKITAELYTAGIVSKTEAERLLPFSNNSGPLFIVGAVGTGMLCQPAVGIFLYFVHVVSALLVGLCFRFYKTAAPVRSRPAPLSPTKERSLTAMFSTAVVGSVTTILNVCGYIVLFATITDCITPFLNFLPPHASLSVKSLLEVTNGSLEIAQSGLSLQLTLTWLSGFIGFGGICVMMQVAGILSGTNLSLKPYMLGKMLQGLFSAIITYYACPLIFSDIKADVAVWNTIDYAPLSGSSDPVVAAISALLLVVCIILCICKARKQWFE